MTLALSNFKRFTQCAYTSLKCCYAGDAFGFFLAYEDIWDESVPADALTTVDTSHGLKIEHSRRHATTCLHNNNTHLSILSPCGLPYTTCATLSLREASLGRLRCIKYKQADRNSCFAQHLAAKWMLLRLRMLQLIRSQQFPLTRIVANSGMLPKEEKLSRHQTTVQNKCQSNFTETVW